MKLKILLIIISLMLSGCSLLKTKERPVKVITKEVEREIIHPALPDKIIMKDVKWKVLTAETLDELDLDNEVYYVITVKGYENLSKNMAELKRYLKEQKQIIIYYRELK